MRNSRKKLLFLTTALVLLWCLAAWQIAARYFISQMRNTISQQTRLSESRTDDLSDSIRRNLYYLSGIPEMLVHLMRVHKATAMFGENVSRSGKPYAERKRNWTENPTLNDLSRYLAIVQSNLDVDQVYLVNAAGDSIASSNWNQPGSSIGTNVAEQDFFLSNKARLKGMQYAVGKTTHLSGLYFSSPVLSDGHFMGAVAVKIDVSGLNLSTQKIDTFISDENGVIILAHDKSLEIHAMPNASVFGMTDSYKLEHYQRTDIAALPMASWGSEEFPELQQMDGSPIPCLLSSRNLPEYGLTVHTREYLYQLPALKRERWLVFLLLAFFGSLPIMAACGIFLYLNSVKRSKAILLESEQRLSMTLKCAADAVFIARLDGSIIYANDNAVSLLGYSADELTRMTIFDLVPADWRETYKQGAKQILANDQRHVFEVRLVKKDGAKIPMELSTVQLPNSTMYGSCRDITERKSAEAEIASSRQALSDERQLFQSILDNAPIGIWMLGIDGKIKFINETFCNAVGVTEQELQSASHYSDVLPPAIAANHMNSDRECFASESPHHSTEAISFVDGKEHILEITKVRLYGQNGDVTGLIGLAVDMTDIKHSEAVSSGQKKVLEMIATGTPLPETLDAVVRLIERLSSGMLGAVLLLDEEGAHFCHVAAPSMSPEFIAAVRCEPIGSRAGPCGMAAYRKEAVYVEDIATDPLWVDYKELSLQHGLRGCRSTPIFDLQHRVLGIFSMYYRQPGLFQPEHSQLVDIATQTVTIAINHELAENALRKSEAAFRTLFESSHDAFVILHPDKGFIDGNQAAIDLFGCRGKQELINLSTASASPEFQPDGRRSDEIAQEMMRLALEQGSHFFEWTHKRMDGTEFFADVLLTRIDIEGKKLLNGTVRDISKRKQADSLEQQRLDELEAVYLLSEAIGNAASLDQIFEESMNFMLRLLKADRVAILLLDADGLMQFKAWRGLSEVYRKACLEQAPWTQNVVDFRPLLVEDIESDVNGAVPKNQMTPEGIRALGLIPLVQQGRLLGKFMVYFDTPHAFSEREIQLALNLASHVSLAIDRKLAEQQFVDIFEFAPDALVMTDMQATIKMVNRQAESLFGYSAQELIGQSIEVLIPQERTVERRDMRQRFLFSATRPRPLDATSLKDLRSITKGGRIFPVEISLSPMESPSGTMIAAAVRDVSERKQVMDQLRSTTAELEQANVHIEEERLMLAQRVMERTAQLLLANKAKDSFLATMSHEIRTPLGGLLGMIELLGHSKLDHSQLEMLHMAQSSSKSLLRIVDDILDWSKIEAGKLQLVPRPASIRESLINVINTYAQVASAKGVVLHYRVDPKLSMAHIFDPLRLLQILNNFTSNAIKFTAKGDVEIRAELVSQQNDSERVRFSVRDSGIGIDKKQQAHLFQQYEQASRDTARMYGGTGLGLAICNKLAELMEGTIDLESVPEIGSTFYFTVNFSVANLAAQRELQLSIDKHNKFEEIADVIPLVMRGQYLSVLVVDDHPVNRMLLKLQLEQLGLHVEVAESGITGLSMWSTGNFDFIVTDCHMPGIDGYELTRSIREIERQNERKRVPIIAWTANVLAEEEERCRAAGMDDLLTKPTELSTLRSMLLKWLLSAEPPNLHLSGFSETVTQHESVTEPAINFGVLKKFALNRAMQVEMLKEFTVHNRSDITTLNAILKDGNPTGVAHATHRIRGACRMVGAMQLEDVCARIEKAARQKNMQGAQAAAEHELNEAVARVEATIAKFVSGQ
jgi:PAS domain S-box-containing protein